MCVVSPSSIIPTCLRIPVGVVLVVMGREVLVLDIVGGALGMRPRFQREGSLTLALLRELRDIQRHMSLRALSARDVDVADAGAVRTAGIRGELAEHDEVECVLLVC